MLSIANYLFDNPKLPGALTDNLIYEIIEDIISNAVKNKHHFNPENNEFSYYPQLRRLLLKDGFIIKDGKLIRTFETDIDFSSNETLLGSLLKKHNLGIAKGHYDQAPNAFNRGDWAACNSQIRSYMEALLNNLSEKVTGHTPLDSQSARISLSQCNPQFFIKN